MRSLGTAEPRAARFDAQIPCWLHCGPETFGGLVTNVSDGGLFVRTEAPVVPPQTIELSLWSTPAAPHVDVTARVAWQARPTAGASADPQPGIGLEIQSAPAAYTQLVHEVSGLFPVTCAQCSLEVLVAVADPTELEHPFAYFAPAKAGRVCPNRQDFLEPGAPRVCVSETCVGLGKAVLGALTDGTLKLVR